MPPTLVPAAPPAAPAAAAATIPAAAPAAPELPPLIPPPPLDPYLAKLVKSFETTLDRPIDLTPAPIAEEEPQRPSRSLIEALSDMEHEAAPAPAAPAEQTQGAATPPVATPEAPASHEEPTAPPKVQQSEADKLREELDRLPEATPAAPAPDPTPEPAKPTEDEAWLNGLSDSQREEIDLATFAEAKYPELKGKRQETINWLKKIQEWTNQHPDGDPDGDEFIEFNEKVRPKYETVERRKVERAQLEEQILAKARKESEEAHREQYAELRRKQYELEIRPQVKKAKDEFAETLTSPTLPEGVSAIDKEILQAVMTGQPDAFERYPVEAPILRSTIQAGQEYLDISTGLKAYEPSNPTHQWLGKFMYDQGQILKAKPKDVRTMDGKEFLPRHEYADMVQKDPKAASQHWTFTDGQILDMLKVNAALAIGAETKRLQNAGWARNSNVKTQPTTENGHAPAPSNGQAKPPAPSTNGNPPRAGSSIGVGEAATGPNRLAESKFFEAILPGSTKVLSQ